MFIIFLRLVESIFGGLVSNKIHTFKFRKLTLTLAVSLNLITLGYFKYFNFFIFTLNDFTNTSFELETILLPLAISFFTFQQIAYLVDSYRNKVTDRNFKNYSLFVLFFPQLIAGPIVHHNDLLPQFNLKKSKEKLIEGLGIGVVLFFIGMFKKVVLADSLAGYSDPVFERADSSGVSFFDAWGGSLAYTFQLYFDFSGYADMAVGVAMMFGIKLPMNFNSPYKSLSIVDFWRRWHITLGQFLRDYLYISFGGNRVRISRKYFNLFLTMLLGGLWHGAGWTFLVWGGLHGIYLVINNIWSSFMSSYSNKFINILSWFVTFLAVVVGWVFFRSSSFESSLEMLAGMIGLNGFILDSRLALFMPDLFDFIAYSGSGVGGFANNIMDAIKGFTLILLSFIVVLCLPNSTEYVLKHIRWRWLDALFLALLIVWSLAFISQPSEFLYFQF
jgi:alginate O-acetyltransferase complex protein AlgI